MYSGSDSTGSQNYNNQWPLNPAAYQNTPNDQIDWAALAQQWIIMKEAGPPVPEQLTAPPPPKLHTLKKDNSFEGGEAPMEVENEKEDEMHPPNWNENNSTDPAWNWNQQQNWGWGGNAWSAPSAVPPPAPGAPKAPLLPTPPTYNQYSSSSDNSNNYGGTPNEYSGGYWTASGNKLKPHNKRYSKVNVSTRPPLPTPTLDPLMLDATKRKQLPAWIREGLEKMERDKQKQIEKEREKQEKQDVSEKSLLNEKEALEIIKSTVKERERSKFDSDAEDSPIESNNRESGRNSPESVLLTQEELMLKVRRTMTEILLKVTNQEIRAVCKEEYQRKLRKQKASDQRLSAPSGTNISGKLGLGMYGDSASSSDNSDTDSEQTKSNSDAELKDAIKRRKAEFSKTEREIEARLAAAAEKHLDDDSRGGTPKTDCCDSQVDAKSQGHKIKTNKDGTSLKSVFKRQKSRKDSISSSEESDSDLDRHIEEKQRKIAKSKKSSSSESSQSQKYPKERTKHRRSRDHKSLSPERKRNKEKTRRSVEQKLKHSESSSSKSSSTRSRRSRSKSVEVKRRKSRSSDRSRRTSYKSYYSKKSRSRSSSGSNRSRSYTRSHRSASRNRRSQSYTKPEKSRRSRSRTRSERSHRSRSPIKSRKSRSRSRSTNHSGRTHSKRKSKSYSPELHHRRKLRSRSGSRGKRSHRH